MGKEYKVLNGFWKGLTGHVVWLGRDKDRVMLQIMHESQEYKLFTGWFELTEIEEVGV